MALARLSKIELNKIQNQKAIFLRAQELTGVPWQAVAAIWYRESFSVTPPRTPGGPFQFDPIPSPAKLDDLLQRYTKCSARQRETLVKQGVNWFPAGAIFAACWLRHSCKPNLAQDHSDEAMKDAFYGYNGRKYGSADQSPYVMSQYDEAHSAMVLRGTIPDASQPDGRRWVEIVDKRPGAFTVYRQLLLV